ncbi:MAG: class A beta-lactamase-related serine hydrolase, partial [Bacteroidetes bacterium]
MVFMPLIMRVLLLSGFLLVLASCQPPELAPGPAGQIEAAARPYLAAGTLTGLSVGLIRGDTITHWHGGVVEAGGGQAPGDSTIYGLAGFTQVYTAALMADLSLSGEVNPEAELSAYLPWALPEGLTLAHLATHTGGLAAEVA